MAERFEDIRFALTMEGKDNEPQFTRTEYFTSLKLSASNLRSTAGVLECTYLASILTLRDIRVSSLASGEGLTRDTKVDLRLYVPRIQEDAVNQTGFVEQGLHNQ